MKSNGTCRTKSKQSNSTLVAYIIFQYCTTPSDRDFTVDLRKEISTSPSVEARRSALIMSFDLYETGSRIENENEISTFLLLLLLSGPLGDRVQVSWFRFSTKPAAPSCPEPVQTCLAHSSSWLILSLFVRTDPRLFTCVRRSYRVVEDR